MRFPHLEPGGRQSSKRLATLAKVKLKMSETAVPATPAKAKTIHTPVMMTDGRVVQFAGDRKVDKSVLADESGAYVGVRFDFRNGETRSVHLSELSESIVQYASCHGLLQKIGDEWSGVTAIEDIVLTCEEMIKRLQGGAWEAEGRGGSGDSMAGASIVIRAFVEASGKTADEVKSFLEAKLAAGKESGLTRQKLYASFRNPTSKVGQIIRRLEDERAAKAAAVDADAVLAEMGA